MTTTWNNNDDDSDEDGDKTINKHMTTTMMMKMTNTMTTMTMDDDDVDADHYDYIQVLNAIKQTTSLREAFSVADHEVSWCSDPANNKHNSKHNQHCRTLSSIGFFL